VRTRIIIPAAAIAIVVAVGAWTVMASRLFVWMGGLSAYFPSPWITWWRYAHQPRINGSTVAYLIASGLITALPILLIVVIVVAVLRSGTRRPSLYGKTGWADRREMRRGGIRSERSPF